MNLIETTQAGAFAPGASHRSQPGTGSPGQGANRQVWLREMERAQVSGWFQPFNESSVPPGSGKLSEGSVPHTSTAVRPSAAFALQVQREGTAETEDHKPLELRQASLQAATEPDALVEAAQSVATETSVQRSDDNSVSSSAAGLSLEAPERWPEARIQEEIASQSKSVPTATSWGGFSARPLALSDAPHAGDASALLRRTPVSPFVLVAPQAALAQSAALSTHSSQDVASADATATAGRSTDEVDAPSNSSDVVRAVLSGQASTRLHSVWTAEGLNLWLGMDGSAQQVSAQAALIASTLQHTLKSHGHRLNRVVCNGSVVFDASSPSSATARNFSAEFERHLPARSSTESHPFLSHKETS